MGVASRIYNNRVEGTPRSLNPSDQFPFRVRLPEVDDLDIQFGRPLANELLDFSQRRLAINIGFTLTEEVQIWTVKEQNLHWQPKLRWSIHFCRCNWTVCPQPAEEEKLGPGNRWNIEIELDKAVQRKP